MKRSVIGLRLVDLALRHHGVARWPRADWATYDRAMTAARARSSRACLLVDVEQRAQTPDGCEHRQRRLYVHADVAGVHRDRERLGRRQARG
jgi:hypothetical protein